MTATELYRDNFFENLGEVIDYVRGENNNQLTKWGIQEHPLEKWMCIFLEEVGELSKEVLEENPNKMLNESIQVATLSLKLVEMILNKIKAKEGGK